MLHKHEQDHVTHGSTTSISSQLSWWLEKGYEIWGGWMFLGSETKLDWPKSSNRMRNLCRGVLKVRLVIYCIFFYCQQISNSKYFIKMYHFFLCLFIVCLFVCFRNYWIFFIYINKWPYTPIHTPIFECHRHCRMMMGKKYWDIHYYFFEICFVGL